MTQPHNLTRTPDKLGRLLRSLRVSVTDRCNLRCDYCMPEERYVWLPRNDVLHFEEISRLVDVFTGLGVDRLRLTGGEPLLRRELPALVRMLAAKPALADLAITTNGVLLEEQAVSLRDAGMRRVTVSLDTLDAGRFEKLTRRPDHARVLAGIEAASRTGFAALKLDTVVMRGVNDDELAPLVEFARDRGAEVRFIEYMDVGGATRWSMDQVVPRREMLERLSKRFGTIEPVFEESTAPAQRFRLPDGTVFGIIASTTAPFCASCDRSRLTADGMWYLCLYARAGTDLRAMLRAGASDDAIRDRLLSAWTSRADRGAEERLASRDRGALAAKSELDTDPHLEMHTRGG